MKQLPPLFPPENPTMGFPSAIGRVEPKEFADLLAQTFAAIDEAFSNSLLPNDKTPNQM